jgi:hypothetical protein
MGEVLWHLESALQLHQAHLQSATADGLSGHELKLSNSSTNMRRMKEEEESAQTVRMQMGKQLI